MGARLLRRRGMLEGGPSPYHEVIDWCHRRPGATRALGLSWAGIGPGLALRRLPPDEE